MGVTVETLKAVFVADISKFQKNMQKASQAIDKTASRMISAGKKLSLGITLPLIAASVVMVKAAADAEIIGRKFNTVFGESAKAADDFAKSLSKSIGRSRFELKDFLAGVQDTLVPLGLMRDAAANLSQDLVKLAIDVASFQGKQDADVVRAFTTALTGEFESLKQFGIVINQARLDQELLNMGIDGGAKAATQAQKAMAIYNLILASSSDAQGQAAALAGTMAGRLKALRGRTKDLRTEFGERLIPIAEKVVAVFEKVVSRLEKLTPAQQQLAITIGLVAAAIGPVLVGLGLFIKSANLLGTSLVKATKGVVIFGRAMVTRLLLPLLPVAGTIAIIAGVIAALIFAFEATKVALGKFGLSFSSVFQSIVKFLQDKFQKPFNDVMNFVTDKITTVIDFFKNLLGSLLEIVPDSFSTRVKAALATLGSEVKNSADLVGGFIVETWESTANDAVNIWEGLTEKMKELFGGVLKELGIDLDKFTNKLKAAAESVPRPPEVPSRFEGVPAPELAKRLRELGQEGMLGLVEVPLDPNIVRLLEEVRLRKEEIAEINKELERQGITFIKDTKEILTSTQKYKKILGEVTSRTKEWKEALQEVKMLMKEDIVKILGTIKEKVLANIEEFTNLERVTSRVADILMDGLLGVADALGAVIQRTKSFKEAFKELAISVLKDIAQLLLRLLVLETAKLIISSTIGAFAHGGSLGSGKVGLVGEQGPELITGPAHITPIKDGIGGGDITIIVNNNAPGTEATVRQGANNREIAIQIENVIAEDFARGGKVARAAQQSFSLKNKTIRR